MSKGSGRRPQRVGSDVMADNWKNIFEKGREWAAYDLDGKMLGKPKRTFEEAHQAGLDSTANDITFSVMEI